jgi:nucleoid-associated protein YgaU
MPDGLLVKLTILPFKDADTLQMGIPAGPPFIAQFTPESFSVNSEIEYAENATPKGKDGGEAKFASVKPRTFAFEFLMDGTGAAGISLPVLAQIALFRNTVGFIGEIHRPRFLVVTWGSFIATCAIESFSINYKLFHPNGTPLRAVLSATFREHRSNTLVDLLMNLSSPDVTHRHRITAGDRLSTVVADHYGDPGYYIAVARHNDLDSPRLLEAGQVLELPPLGKED